MFEFSLYILLVGILGLGASIIMSSSCIPDNFSLLLFVLSIILLIVGGILTGCDILVLAGVL